MRVEGFKYISHLVEGSNWAAPGDAEPEYGVAGGRDQGVPVPGLLYHPHPGLRSEHHQHPGTHVALPSQQIKYQYNQRFLPHISDWIIDVRGNDLIWHIFMNRKMRSYNHTYPV